MFSYILRRLGQSFIVLLLVMLITFTLPYFEVGGIWLPPMRCSARTPIPTPSTCGASNTECTSPYIVRFWEYIDQVFIHFNLGRSYKQNLSVWAIISIYVPRTLWLASPHWS